jgi:hypothetical protein
MRYKITDYTKIRARLLGVIVKPSVNPDKKLDVFDKYGNYITSVGATGYYDYPTYLELEKKGKVPTGYADTRRKAYKSRHIDRKIVGSRSWFADQLLW